MVSTPAQVHPPSTVPHTCQIVGTQAQARPPSTVSKHVKLPNGKHTRSSATSQHCVHARRCTRSVLYPRMPNGYSTPGPPAQHCIHARQMVSIRCTRPALYQKKHTRTRSALYPRMPDCKHTRSSAPAQHCSYAPALYAYQTESTPAQLRPLGTVPRMPDGTHTRSRAPAHAQDFPTHAKW